MKKYNKAPLPFQGQKRNYLKIFNRELQKLCGDGTGWTIVDVFGGSGLLSHNSKYTCPNARVIYNDYDNYTERLSKIETAEQVRRDLLTFVNGYSKYEQLTDGTREQIINYLHGKEIDYLTMYNYILYSGNFASSLEDIKKSTKFYNRISKISLSCDGYLEGVETVHKCFTQLMKDEFDGNVLYLLDPPYVNTHQGYHRDKSHYFGLLSQLKLFELMKPPFFYFTSNKSEVMDFVDSKNKYSYLFNNCETFTTKNAISGRSTYLDILITKTI